MRSFIHLYVTQTASKGRKSMRSWTFIVLVWCTLVGTHEVKAQDLMSHTDVAIGSQVWAYTLFNDEPTGSPNFISSFYLAVDAPISTVLSPTAWDYQTDNSTYVLWFNPDSTLPYPNDIAPGNSLGGFVIQSSSLTSQMEDTVVASWDHGADAPGPSKTGAVLAPVATPEPGAGMLLASGGFILGLCTRRRKIRQTLIERSHRELPARCFAKDECLRQKTPQQLLLGP